MANRLGNIIYPRKNKKIWESWELLLSSIFITNNFTLDAPSTILPTECKLRYLTKIYLKLDLSIRIEGKFWELDLSCLHKIKHCWIASSFIILGKPTWYAFRHYNLDTSININRECKMRATQEIYHNGYPIALVLNQGICLCNWCYEKIKSMKKIEKQKAPLRMFVWCSITDTMPLIFLNTQRWVITYINDDNAEKGRTHGY